MLTEKKLRSNRRALSICAKLGLVPFQLKDEGRKIVLNIPIFHRIIWVSLLSVSIVNVGYIWMRLFETLVRRRETEFSELGTHIVRCTLSATMVFWAYDGCVAHIGEKAMIYNYVNAPLSPGTLKKPSASFHSVLQDHLLRILPSVLYPQSFFFVGFFIWKTHSTQFLYAAVPENWQTWTVLTLCALFEWVEAIFWMVHAHLFVLSHTPFHQKLDILLANELHFNERSWLLTDLKRKIMMMRELQTAIGIHNLGNRRSIFAHRVLCIAQGVVSFYFFIRLVGVSPIVPFMFLSTGIDCIGFCYVMWDNAHVIPARIESMRLAVLRRFPREPSKTKTYLRLRLNAIPACAIQVGSFRSLERNSTLIFTDFVTYNLASVLISF